jgi:hypothetical protein
MITTTPLPLDKQQSTNAQQQTSDNDWLQQKMNARGGRQDGSAKMGRQLQHGNR